MSRFHLTVELWGGTRPDNNTRTFTDADTWYVRDGGVWVLTATERHYFPERTVLSVKEVKA